MKHASHPLLGTWHSRVVGVTLLAVVSLLFAPTSNGHGIQADKIDFIPPAPGTYQLQRIMAVPQGKVVDIDGKAYKFAHYTTDKVTLLSFIYTYCVDPEGCPLAYERFQNLKKSIESTPAMRDKVRFVSLSFDPQNDTPEVMRLYGGKNASDDRGLRWHFLTTRSPRELKPLLDGLGQDVSVAVDRPAGERVPILSHMLKVFLIDGQSQVREIYTTSFLLPEVVLNDIKTLLMENGTTVQ